MAVEGLCQDGTRTWSGTVSMWAGNCGTYTVGFGAWFWGRGTGNYYCNHLLNGLTPLPPTLTKMLQTSVITFVLVD